MPTIACIQFDMAWENKPANYQTVAEMVRSANLAPGSLLVVPEMFATGFSMNATGIVEPVRGPTHDFLASLARQHQLFVLGGVVQPGPTGTWPALNGRPRNEAIAISPDGQLLARYAKMHPFTLGGEKDHYAAGDEIVQFEWQGLKVTPFICYDLRFPELFRRAAKLGTDLFVVIASWPAPRTHHWTTLLQARAIENQAFVIGNNRCGSDPKLTYDGRSLVIDYAGTILADGGTTPSVVTAAINPEAMRSWRTKMPFLADMRDDL
ncbi:carbon-nitrogen family hydrolase [Humisphaera borealis]|uniref:Carbon-nitrogen family hydrolase n=1 Tax=Humisphaera borealis TaxID=2807512 RepID=A0A7M2X096_9BACT|nr:carbon-nitrogen family hydrolase [Humisphaera borealis]QOV91093.1 carbon-nitrogen family hydrolase [Humisphaera borealis]